MKEPTPLLTIHYRDPEEGFDGYAVIDSLVDGRCAGGVRVSPTLSKEEVMGLAQAMTRKLKVVQLPLGGVKYGIRYDPASPNRVDALTRFFRHIKPLCAEICGFGPDMGTTPEGLDEVARRIGMKTRHAALAAARDDGETTVKNYHDVLGAKVGPLSVLEARTGVGVAAAVDAAVDAYELERPQTIALQGFGQVGSGAAWYLQRLGHKIVAVSDIGGCYHDPEGLDIEAMIENKLPNGLIDPEKFKRTGDPDAIYATECDGLVLAAMSYAVTKDNVDQVRASWIVEGGNLTVTPEAEAVLTGRKVPVVPDFLTNGGAIALVGGVILLGWDVSDPANVLELIRERVHTTVTDIAAAAQSKGVTMREIALERFG